MKYQLVLQFSTDSLDNFDEIIRIEDILIEKLENYADIDGHDIGSDQANIFIFTDKPIESFQLIKGILNNNILFNIMKAAYREVSKSNYIILWPETLTSFSIK